MRGSTVSTDRSGFRLSCNGGLFTTRVDGDIYGVTASVNSGFFRNVGATQRRGIEFGAKLETGRWSATLGYTYVDATFESSLVLNSPTNPFHVGNGRIQVTPGDRLPGILRHQLRATLDRELTDAWTIGLSLQVTSAGYFRGDESNQNAPLAGYHVLSLHSGYRFDRRFEAFVTLHNASMRATRPSGSTVSRLASARAGYRRPRADWQSTTASSVLHKRLPRARAYGSVWADPSRWRAPVSDWRVRNAGRRACAAPSVDALCNLVPRCSAAGESLEPGIARSDTCNIFSFFQVLAPR